MDRISCQTAKNQITGALVDINRGDRTTHIGSTALNARFLEESRGQTLYEHKVSSEQTELKGILERWRSRENNSAGASIAMDRILKACIHGFWRLDLTGLKLTSFPYEVVGNLTKLRDLDLSHNQLTSLSPEIGEFAMLQTLNLSHNSLSSLPREIAALKQLENLHLNGNRLSSLPFTIGTLAKLTFLDLRSNTTLTKLPMALANLPSCSFPCVDTSIPSEQVLAIREGRDEVLHRRTLLNSAHYLEMLAKYSERGYEFVTRIELLENEREKIAFASWLYQRDVKMKDPNLAQSEVAEALFHRTTSHSTKSARMRA